MVLVPLLAFSIVFYLKGFEIASIYSILLVLNLLAFFFGKSLPNRTLFIFAVMAVGLLIVALFTNGTVAMWSVIGIGLFNSIMWSNIFTLAIAGLGKYTSQGSSLLVMAIVGGAILPLSQGALADVIGVHKSFVIPVVAYLYIAYYGLKGYKPKLIQKKNEEICLGD